MTKCSFVLWALVVSQAALGETIEVESKGHYVPLNEPDWIELGDGREAYPGYRRHIASIGKNGKSESHWCNGTNVARVSETELNLEFGAGYCTVFDEDGDAYWTWFVVDGLGAFEWKVMGGTGKYRGATGDGVSTTAGTMPDGTAVFNIKGKIELSKDAD